jgi:hypothetical protein
MNRGGRRLRTELTGEGVKTLVSLTTNGELPSGGGEYYKVDTLYTAPQAHFRSGPLHT